MEKELVETFEAARKAADAVASGGGGPAEAEMCVDALQRLKKFPVTTRDLVQTQIGKRLRCLAKHSEEKIRSVASDILQLWKTKVIEETSKGTTNNKAPQENKLLKVMNKYEMEESMKAEKIPNAGSENPKEKIKISESMMKAEMDFDPDKLLIPANKTVVNSDRKTPPKLTSIIKCNDPARDRYREILAEALSKVSGESSKSEREEIRSIMDEIEARDPIRVAVTVEPVLFERLGPPTGSHKQKYRSIMFNLKDANNPDFRRRVLLGQVTPEEIVDMTVAEMASDERKRENERIKEKALLECELGGAPMATTDQFKCGRCGQRKTTYFQMQTRSADEPMTTYVTCVNCNNHWKFC